MDKDFDYYFNEIKSKRIENKFVLILGSGFHKQAFTNNGNINNCLSSWCCLLKAIDSKIDFSNNYILDFERIILKETNNQDKTAANKIENEILLSTSKKIKVEQAKALNNTNVHYPLGIFNNNFVSDVIILNFDLIPELLLNNNKNSKVQFVNNSANKKSILYSTRHRKINSIKYWHPHGDISNCNQKITMYHFQQLRM